eukprot:TRINITY_DN4011_c0_g1_i1.p1 TRINITY_DN4011_c0_g1~~TRINITY_DN4011_c0_g1_i1.p1  ORF type:complete len:330 (+),score=74.96 TRINITY_DN4011_c0_g1_i1:81-1070(+)
MFTVRWAPFNVPIERRLQTLAVLTSIFSVFFILGFLGFLALLPLFYPLYMIYFYYYYHDERPVKGGDPWKALKSSKFWHYYRDYFPVSLQRTTQLDPSKNYVFAYHPHGIIGVGAWCNFLTEATKFSELFPGIDLRLLTLSGNFKIPIFREYLLWMGLCDVSRNSCDYILQRGPGKSIMIVVGGAAEALDAQPNQYELTIARRKGFVKVALQNGAHLVPVISFGENDIFNQVANPEGSRVRKFQRWCQSLFGFSLPFFHGRGIFNYDFGLLPHRRPVHTIVGKPIPVKKISEPTDEQLDEYHSKYMTELQNLFDQHKKTYAPGSTLKFK